MSTTTDKIANPNEHLQIPAWINADYFEKNILAKHEPNFAKVVKFTPIAAIPPGENFTSIMVRIHMDLEMSDGSQKQQTYVLKTMLDDDKGGSMVNELGLFDKEVEMYERYLPAFEALYKAAGRQVQLAPKCLFIESRERCINFVFEDLRNQKFQNVDRVQGFDLAHMRRVLEKLAQLHAASAVYAEQNGAYPAKFYNGFINRDKSFAAQQRAFHLRAGTYKKAMSLWGLADAERYIAKFPTFEQYWQCCFRTLDVESNAFNVLIHGDFWSSNVMQNYLPNGGGIQDLLFVDYQLCKWGSPVEDLLFFISISAAKDIRVKEFDNFVAIYHEHLIECLRLLGYKKALPKLRELHMDMYRENTTFYAFFAVFNHLVAVLLPTDKDSNLHSLMRDDAFGEQFRMRAYTNPLLVEAMKDLFPFFDKRGLFNFEDYDERK